MSRTSNGRGNYTRELARWMLWAVGVVAAVSAVVILLLASPLWLQVGAPLGCVIVGQAVLYRRSEKRSQPDTYARESDIGIFVTRNDATQSMLADLADACRVAFVGIRHSTLASYLKDVIEAPRQIAALPWAEIDILFARDDVGEEWRRGELEAGGRVQDPRGAFHQDLHDAIAAVAHRLCSPSGRAFWRDVFGEDPIAELSRVSFRQSNDAHYFGGSFVKARDDRDTVPFSLLYLTLDIPHADLDAKNSFTMGLRGHRSKRESDLLKRYTSGYEYLLERARTLVEIDPRDAWHSSADAWCEFLKFAHNPVYERITKAFGTFAELAPSMNVLDLGSGPGITSEVFAETIFGNSAATGSLLLVDISPEMVRRANAGHLTSAYPRAHAIVGDARRPLFGSYSEMKFDRILANMSLANFLPQQPPFRESLTEIATAWREMLACDGERAGEIAISLHNGVFQCEPPPGEWTWPADDPLRQALANYFRARHGKHCREPRPVITQADVDEAFAEAGLVAKTATQQSFPRTMSDRLKMWRVPAILDSMVDVNAIGRDECEAALLIAEQAVAGKETPPTIVTFQRFALSP